MKVGKHYLGKYTEVIWRDPGEARMVHTDPDFRPRGKQCLATWRERGIIVDLTEGIVQIEHSHASGAPHLRQPDESVITFVPEDLIEGIVVYEPVKGGGEQV